MIPDTECKFHGDSEELGQERRRPAINARGPNRGNKYSRKCVLQVRRLNNLNCNMSLSPSLSYGQRAKIMIAGKQVSYS